MLSEKEQLQKYIEDINEEVKNTSKYETWLNVLNLL